MSARRRGQRSPLLRTLYLTLWMGGIGLVLYTPLFIILANNSYSEHVIAWLLAASALIPTVGAAVFAAIPKTTIRRHILAAVIAILAHGAISFVTMAAYSLILGVENLSQVILLTVSWIPAVLMVTLLSTWRIARQKRLEKRGLYATTAPISPARAISLSALGGLLFSAALFAVNGFMYLIASADAGSVVAGLIFPVAWGLFATHRPRPAHKRAYLIAAITTGSLLSTVTFLFSAALHMARSSMVTSLFDLIFHAPLTAPGIPLALVSLSMTIALPLWTLSKRGDTEESVVESLG